MSLPLMLAPLPFTIIRKYGDVSIPSRPWIPGLPLPSHRTRPGYCSSSTLSLELTRRNRNLGSDAHATDSADGRDMVSAQVRASRAGVWLPPREWSVSCPQYAWLCATPAGLRHRQGVSARRRTPHKEARRFATCRHSPRTSQIQGC